jgi:hypothetical protein
MVVEANPAKLGEQMIVVLLKNTKVRFRPDRAATVLSQVIVILFRLRSP